jgi:hypothetical protein
MAFYYILLGHLIGDFVLQTDRIAENKGKHWQWTLLHALVVTLCIFLLSYPFGLLVNVLVILSGILHFVFDYCKAAISKSLHLSKLIGFLFDQLVHITIIYLISFTAIYSQTPHILNFLCVKFILVFVFVTSFSAVFIQFIFTAIFPGKNSKFFEDGEKLTGILTRLFLCMVFYLALFISPLYILMSLAVGIIVIIWRVSNWKKRMEPFHLLIKLLFDILFSALGILLIII